MGTPPLNKGGGGGISYLALGPIWGEIRLVGTKYGPVHGVGVPQAGLPPPLGGGGGATVEIMKTRGVCDQEGLLDFTLILLDFTCVNLAQLDFMVGQGSPSSCTCIVRAKSECNQSKIKENWGSIGQNHIFDRRRPCRSYPPPPPPPRSNT